MHVRITLEVKPELIAAIELARQQMGLKSRAHTIRQLLEELLLTPNEMDNKDN